jgi:WD40 repeat protein
MKQSSIFCLESPTLNISPAHQDVISEIFPVQLDTFYLASASFDGKVKFWKLQNNVFVLAFSL